MIYFLLNVQGAKSLVPLLDLALTKIPPAKRKKTPVALKATAGLRLLPGNQAEVILNQVSCMNICSRLCGSSLDHGCGCLMGSV